VPKEDCGAAQSIIENTSRPRNPLGMEALYKFSPMIAHIVQANGRVQCRG